MAVNWRFATMVLASLVAFYGVVLWALRARPHLPPRKVVAAVSAIVVVGGMLFAKAGTTAVWPVWLYYGVPASLTWFLPPLAFRMGAKEMVEYLILAILVAPAVHIAFSLALGWKEYMPFIPVPSLRELLGLAA